jgi:hypothetical protein
LRWLSESQNSISGCNQVNFVLFLFLSKQKSRLIFHHGIQFVVTQICNWRQTSSAIIITRRTLIEVRLRAECNFTVRCSGLTFQTFCLHIFTLWNDTIAKQLSIGLISIMWRQFNDVILIAPVMLDYLKVIKTTLHMSTTVCQRTARRHNMTRELVKMETRTTSSGEKLFWFIYSSPTRRSSGAPFSILPWCLVNGRGLDGARSWGSRRDANFARHLRGGSVSFRDQMTSSVCMRTWRFNDRNDAAVNNLLPLADLSEAFSQWIRSLLFSIATRRRLRPAGGHIAMMSTRECWRLHRVNLVPHQALYNVRRRWWGAVRDKEQYVCQYCLSVWEAFFHKAIACKAIIMKHVMPLHYRPIYIHARWSKLVNPIWPEDCAHASVTSGRKITAVSLSLSLYLPLARACEISLF